MELYEPMVASRRLRSRRGVGGLLLAASLATLAALAISSSAYMTLALVLTPRAEALTVSEGTVYWTKSADMYGRGAAIGRANVNGTGMRENLITGIIERVVDDTTGALAVSGPHIYWGIASVGGPNDGAIGRARLKGGRAARKCARLKRRPARRRCARRNGKPVRKCARLKRGLARRRCARRNGKSVQPSFITGLNPGGLAAHGRHLYWTNFVDYSPKPRGPAIGRSLLNGRRVQRSFIRARGSARIGAKLTVGASGIYWGSGRGADPAAIVRADLSAERIDRRFIELRENQTLLITSEGHVIDLDGPSIYYTQQTTDGWTVRYRSIDPSVDGSGELMEARFKDVASLAVADSYLYWVREAAGDPRSSIMRAKILRRQVPGPSLTERLGPRERVVTIRNRGHEIR